MVLTRSYGRFYVRDPHSAVLFLTWGVYYYN